MGGGTSRMGGCDRDRRGSGMKEAVNWLLRYRETSSLLLRAPGTDSPTDRPEWGSYGEGWFREKARAAPWRAAGIAIMIKIDI